MEFLSRNPDIVQIHYAFPETIIQENMGNPLGYKMWRYINKRTALMVGLHDSQSNLSGSFKVINHVPGGERDIDVEGDLNHGAGDSIATLVIHVRNELLYKI